MTVLPARSNTRVRGLTMDLTDALLPAATILPSRTASASTTDDRSSMVRTFPLIRTRSGDPRSACCAYVGLARHRPAPRSTRGFTFLIIMKFHRLSLFDDGQ